LLCVLARAELRFFNDRVVIPPIVPTCVEQVMDVTSNTRADGLTAPAVLLQDLYAQRRVVKYFVLVTDEIENEPAPGTTDFFAQLFYKYYTEVFPARLLTVSFLENPGQKGRMVLALEEHGIIPLQFCLDASRPDLTKVDSLLGMMASECPFFQEKSLEIAQMLADGAPLAELVSKYRQQTAYELSSLATSSTATSSTAASSNAGPELELPFDAPI